MLSIKYLALITLTMFSFSNLFSQSKETVTYIDTPLEKLKMDI
jgi:hypothetical protein